MRKRSQGSRNYGALLSQTGYFSKSLKQLLGFSFDPRKYKQYFHKSNCIVISNTINEGCAWPSRKRDLKNKK